MTWKQRITGQGTEDPQKLLVNPDNWRVHPQSQQRAMKGALDELGWIQQIIVNQRTGRLIDGHLRVELAKKHKAKEVPVIYVDLTEEEEKLALATLDPISALADSNAEMLEALLSQVETDNDGLLELLAELEPDYPQDTETVVAEEPEEEILSAPKVTQSGDIWQIDEHRLMCGSSTDPQSVDLLMDGRTTLFYQPALWQPERLHHRWYQRLGQINDRRLWRKHPRQCSAQKRPGVS
ncbi:ParB N-terminal domain-containing protein [Endozoicomonas sp. ALB032]|uniref:ParB N-terminal domain-containing protein n=1 Tax=Endozoicomonas sp. ALB032 TaxID=3403082 RepID=UPI003BB5E2EB